MESEILVQALDKATRASVRANAQVKSINSCFSPNYQHLVK